MTNQQIILNESIKLMQNGELKGSGQFAEIETDEGKKTIELPEAIYTFQKWKSLGYIVKKGEKSKIKFVIWKHTSKQIEVDEKSEEVSKMFMKMASFFKFDQVQKIEHEEEQ